MNFKILSLTIFLFILCVKSFTYKQFAEINENQSVEFKQNVDYRISTFKVLNNWGFKIFKNNKLLINQTTIPAISGNKSFKTKKEAKSVAKLMVEKLKKGIMPPSITEKELDSLKIKI